jgi:uncharacterized protein RhaS with RHS repeats
VTDDESGLVYMRARYYEPGTGRFVGEDPAMDGWNWYVYCGSKPTDNIDPSGREFLPAWAKDFWDWTTKVFRGWGVELAELPPCMVHAADAYAAIMAVEKLAEAMDIGAKVANGFWMSSLFLASTPAFAWVPSMLFLIGKAFTFAAILARVIALTIFAQVAIQLYIDALEVD